MTVEIPYKLRWDKWESEHWSGVVLQGDHNGYILAYGYLPSMGTASSYHFYSPKKTHVLRLI